MIVRTFIKGSIKKYNNNYNKNILYKKRKIGIIKISVNNNNNNNENSFYKSHSI